MLSPNFAIVGAVINLFGCIMYAKDTVKGNTSPNRVSWVLWTIAPLVAFVAELSQGVKLQSLIVFSSGFGPLIVLAASFIDKKAYWKIRWFDWLCGALSVIAISLWAITGKGNIAIVFAIVADLLACIPTIIKAYAYPETESSSPFVVGVIGVIITILTIRIWNIANYAFPFYLLIANSTIAGLIILRRRSKDLAKNRS